MDPSTQHRLLLVRFSSYASRLRFAKMSEKGSSEATIVSIKYSSRGHLTELCLYQHVRLRWIFRYGQSGRLSHVTQLRPDRLHKSVTAVLDASRCQKVIEKRYINNDGALSKVCIFRNEQIRTINYYAKGNKYCQETIDALSGKIAVKYFDTALIPID